MNKIEACLLDIGIPANLQGFGYLTDAIIDVIEDKTLIDQLTKGLYPEVAEKNGTTWKRVERSIRHSIEVAFDNADSGVVAKYLGGSVSSRTGKPTNSQFIAGMALYLRDDLLVEQETK